MNKKTQTEYVFIAKGIGITPFRSMIQYFIDKKLKKTITLFYIANENEFLFQDIFSKAKDTVGLKTFYLTKDEINEDLLKGNTANYLGATYYLSGPQQTVEKYREKLFKMGIDNNQIKTDLFTGY